jgi:hypothetical protein
LTWKRPSLLVVEVAVVPLDTSVTVTEAPGMGAAVVSETRPVILPRVS